MSWLWIDSRSEWRGTRTDAINGLRCSTAQRVWLSATSTASLYQSAGEASCNNTPDRTIFPLVRHRVVAVRESLMRIPVAAYDRRRSTRKCWQSTQRFAISHLIYSCDS